MREKWGIIGRGIVVLTFSRNLMHYRLKNPGM
jgi:hypothetical protein